ncbi:hypothetical protein ACJX0J_009795, partial [Zea mays]
RGSGDDDRERREAVIHHQARPRLRGAGRGGHLPGQHRRPEETGHRQDPPYHLRAWRVPVLLRPRREEPGIVPVELQQEHPESCIQDLERPSGEAVREAWAGQGDHRARHGGADPRAAAPRLGGRPRPALAPAAVRRVARPLQPPGPAAQHRQPARAALRGRRAQLPRPRRARRQRLLRQHHR